MTLAAARRHETPRRRSARSAGSGAASCRASAIADVLGRLDITEVGEALTDIAPPRSPAALHGATRAVDAERGDRADPHGDRPDGTPRRSRGRATGRTPTSCSCTTRWTAPTSRRPRRLRPRSRTELRRCSRRAGPTRRSRSTPDLRPEGATVRSCVRSPRTAPTTRSGRRSGRRRRCCVPAPLVGDPELSAAFTDLIDPLRWPEDGVSDAGRARDPADQGARRLRAPAAWRRPEHPPQAGPRRARRRRVDRPAAADAARPRRRGPAHDRAR